MSTKKTCLQICDHNRATGWAVGTYGDRWFQAKIYDEPSGFGINEGRVSKLCISIGPDWLGMDHVLYNYDRGVDVDHHLGAELAARLEQALLPYSDEEA